MVDVRFELTTNDPWSVDDAICEGISPLGYWQKVNQSSTQRLIAVELSECTNMWLWICMRPYCIPGKKF